MTTTITGQDNVLKFHTQTLDILRQADVFGGVCFGGFVRDFLCRLSPPDCLPETVTVGGIDIWFRTEEDRDAFVRYGRTGEGLSFRKAVRERVAGDLMAAVHPYFGADGNHLIDMHLVVSSISPGFDADCNRLTYNFKSGRIGVGLSGDFELAEAVIKQIREKKMVLGGVATRMLRKNIGWYGVSADAFRKRMEGFAERGWTILGDDMIPYKFSSVNSVCDEYTSHRPGDVIVDGPVVLGRPSVMPDLPVPKTYNVGVTDDNGSVLTLVVKRGTKVDLSDVQGSVSVTEI